jgi:hypothetical protein
LLIEHVGVSLLDVQEASRPIANVINRERGGLVRDPRCNNDVIAHVPYVQFNGRNPVYIVKIETAKEFSTSTQRTAGSFDL